MASEAEVKTPSVTSGGTPKDQSIDGDDDDDDTPSILTDPLGKSRPHPSAEQQMQAQISRFEAKMDPQQLLTNTSKVAKVEQANKDLKKFITTLTLTGPIKRIFEKAEKRAERIHENA